MATEHKHGYRSTYHGLDRSAAEQFSRITDLASELETSYGCVYRTNASGPIGVTTAAKVPFDGVYLTSTDSPLVLVGSRDVAGSTANSRLTVRYGGLYRATFSGAMEYVAAVAAPMVLEFYVNGAPAGFPVSFPVPAPATIVEWLTFVQFLLVPDRGYVEVFCTGAGAGNTVDFQPGCNLSIVGNRL